MRTAVGESCGSPIRKRFSVENIVDGLGTGMDNDPYRIF